MAVDDPALALAIWQSDPVQWGIDWLGDAHVPRELLPGGAPIGVGPFWWRQVEILQSLVENRETNVVTGHGIGKDWLAGRVIPWWVTTRPNSIAVATSAKELQVQTIVWGEVRSASNKARVPFGGTMAPLAPEWRFGPKHYALGMVAKDPNAASGFHGDNVLVLISEAAGVAGEIQAALESCAAGNGRVLRYGNPTCAPTHAFARACSLPDVPGVRKTIRIPSTDTPNYVLGRDVIPGLAGREYVQSVADKFGIQSNTYRARVEAKFSAIGSDALILPEYLDAAKVRASLGVKAEAGVPRRIGCDVARFGDDLSVFYVVQGPTIIAGPLTMAKADGNAVAERVLGLARAYSAQSVAIDGGGLGSSPVDALNALLLRPENKALGLEVLDNDFGSKSTNAAEWADRRTELWWRLRDWIRDEAAVELEDFTSEELLAHRFMFTQRRLERKEQVKARLGRSPDRGDALALAVAGHIGRCGVRPRLSFW